jgi:hypothetical protein
MPEDGLTTREAAFIAAARRTGAAPAACEPDRSCQGIEAFERVAALMQAQRRESELRRARLRRYSTALALLFLLPFLTWSMLMLLPQMLK